MRSRNAADRKIYFRLCPARWANSTARRCEVTRPSGHREITASAGHDGVVVVMCISIRPPGAS